MLKNRNCGKIVIVKIKFYDISGVSMKKLLLIDGNNLLFRSFYALPQLTNFQGEISNAVFGFTNALIKSIKTYKPDYIAVAFDKGKNTFRHKEYKEYKAGRTKTPKELIDQIPITKELLKRMHITVLEDDELEADDIIGCLSRSFNTENYILTADKDLLQLINNHTVVIVPKKGNVDPVIMNEEGLKTQMGIRPSQIVDLKSLMGDASDNIPGVRKIGEKTALDLLAKYDTLDGVYAHIEELKGKLKENLELDKDVAYLSYHLATIITDRNLGVRLEDLTYEFPFSNDVHEFFERYQFNILLNKKELFAGDNVFVREQEKKVKKVSVATLEEWREVVQKVNHKSSCALYIEDNIMLYGEGDKEEYEVSLNNDLFSYQFNIEEVLQALQPIFANRKMTLIGRDIKELKSKLIGNNLQLDCQYFDLLLARYLINCNSKPNVSTSMMCIENGLGEKPSAHLMYVIKDIYTDRLKELELTPLYEDVELPLIDVLFDMEQSGFKIDKQKLIDTNKELSDKLVELENNIYHSVGKEFNLNSPKQLSEILFDHLGLPTKNNKKKSTSVDVLNDLKDTHPVISMILEYRQTYKLYAGYIRAFMDMLDEENLIHTVFNQTMTATGRLSSSEPNLQNIPIRSEEGRAIRKLFLSRFDGGQIVSADYSQVELRLIAHFSKEPNLIDAYQHDKDIHASTASQIFGIPLDKVTGKNRRDAKAVNFGIVYGISDFGLSQNIGCSRAEAAQFIEKYFEKYPKVKEYMDASVAFCKEHGYVKTLFGRMRLIPEINNSNYTMRMFGERAAMNMPLQGTGSDIIKLAMIKVHRRLQSEHMQAKLIVQVHDELVVDCPSDEVEKVKDILRECMENIVHLEVPLPVDVHSGPTWFEAK